MSNHIKLLSALLTSKHESLMTHLLHLCMLQLYAEGATWFIISTTVDAVAIKHRRRIIATSTLGKQK
jgi:hypothetical protein